MKKNVKAAAMILCAASMAMTIGSTAFAEETKTLRVAMECGYAPYNWTQATDENGAVPIRTAPSTHTDTMS
jgi:putative lysine transport system substrate-binding protein